MEQNELWLRFLISGKVEDYLKYSACCQQNADGGKNLAHCDRRIGTTRTGYRRQRPSDYDIIS